MNSSPPASILTRQQDDPMLYIPTGVEGDPVQWKVRVGNVLTGVFIAIAIVVNHCGAVVLHRDLDLYEPITCANLT